MKEYKPSIWLFTILFIVLCAVSARAQTPLRPVIPPRHAEVKEDSPPVHSADQTEESEDSTSEDSANTTEAIEDSSSKDSAKQTEESKDSIPKDFADKTIVNEDSISDNPKEKPEFFFAPLVEIIGYSREGPSFGAGFALGAGNGVVIGARFLYANDTESIHTMEIAVFMRAYLRRTEVNTGPFIQIIAGASIFNYEHVAAPPAKAGALSAGIAAGWRFPLSKRIYIEPSIRAGYPYITGGGVAFAFRL